MFSRRDARRGGLADSTAVVVARFVAMRFLVAVCWCPKQILIQTTTYHQHEQPKAWSAGAHYWILRMRFLSAAYTAPAESTATPDGPSWAAATEPAKVVTTPAEVILRTRLLPASAT